MIAAIVAVMVALVLMGRWAHQQRAEADLYIAEAERLEAEARAEYQRALFEQRRKAAEAARQFWQRNELN